MRPRKAPPREAPPPPAPVDARRFFLHFELGHTPRLFSPERLAEAIAHAEIVVPGVEHAKVGEVLAGMQIGDVLTARNGWILRVGRWHAPAGRGERWPL